MPSRRPGTTLWEGGGGRGPSDTFVSSRAPSAGGPAQGLGEAPKRVNSAKVASGPVEWNITHCRLANEQQITPHSLGGLTKLQSWDPALGSISNPCHPSSQFCRDSEFTSHIQDSTFGPQCTTTEPILTKVCTQSGLGLQPVQEESGHVSVVLQDFVVHQDFHYNDVHVPAVTAFRV